MKRILDVNQNHNIKNEKIYNFVKKEIDSHGLKVVDDIIPIYYDAWQNDDDVDPILSIVNRIVYESRCCVDGDLFKSIEYREVIASILGIFNSGMKQLFKEIGGKDILKYYEDKEKINGKIYELFKKIRKSQSNGKIVVFIDELDRCKPDFALKLLERLKHYVDDKNIVFVISTNLTELQHMISNVYGDHFSSTKYFDRFFDYLFTLPVVEEEKLYDDIGRLNKMNELSGLFIKHFINKYNLEIRGIIRFVSWCELIIPKEKGGTKDLLKAMFLPYMIGIKQVNINLYNEFIIGEGFDFYKNYLSGLDFKICFESLVARDAKELEEETVIEVIKEIYQYIYRTDLYNKYNLYNLIYSQPYKIGTLEIPPGIREEMLDEISVLTCLNLKEADNT